jgi:hypothetical protein
MDKSGNPFMRLSSIFPIAGLKQSPCASFMLMLIVILILDIQVIVHI